MDEDTVVIIAGIYLALIIAGFVFTWWAEPYWWM